MAAPEAKVKAKVKLILKSHNAYYAMPQSGGFASSGIPDFLVCFRGKFFGIECKAGRGKLTELQKKNLTSIQDAGGHAFVIREDNLNLLEIFLNENSGTAVPVVQA